MKCLKTFAAAAIALCASLPVHADQLADILDAGEIKIAVPESFPPFGSVGPSLDHEGYDVDVAKLIAADLGVELEIVPVSSKQRVCLKMLK